MNPNQIPWLEIRTLSPDVRHSDSEEYLWISSDRMSSDDTEEELSIPMETDGVLFALLVPSRNLQFAWETARWGYLC